MNIERQYIFRTIDNPLRVLFWSVDDFLVMISPFFIGVLFGSMLLMCAGFIIKPLFTRLKKNYPNGSYLHMIYWNLPKEAVRLKNMPPSHIREYIL